VPGRRTQRNALPPRIPGTLADSLSVRCWLWGHRRTVEFDGDGVFGDVDGEFVVGVGASEGDFLSDDHDDATVGGAALHGDRFG
jgi:hypothetical protein